MRCLHCGLANPVGAPHCLRCEAPLALYRDEVGAGRSDAGPDVPPPPSRLNRSMQQQNAHPTFIASSELAPLSRSALRPLPQVTGTVIAADPPYLEEPDFDLPRFLQRGLLLFAGLGLPLILLWGFLTFYGPISLILGLLGLSFFFRILSPHNLLAMFGIFHLANPFGRGARHEQAPVQYLRVRDQALGEVIVRRKGHLREGNLASGDEVTLWGTWQGGVLHLRRALNIQTGSRISLRNRSSWLPFWLTLFTLTALMAAFGVPVHRIVSNLQGWLPW